MQCDALLALGNGVKLPCATRLPIPRTTGLVGSAAPPIRGQALLPTRPSRAQNHLPAWPASTSAPRLAGSPPLMRPSASMRGLLLERAAERVDRRLTELDRATPRTPSG